MIPFGYDTISDCLTIEFDPQCSVKFDFGGLLMHFNMREMDTYIVHRPNFSDNLKLLRF